MERKLSLETGKFSRYLYKGKYLASSLDKNYDFSDKSFIVEDKAQEIRVPAYKKGEIPGGGDDLTDDENFENTLELTFSSGVGGWRTVMYLEKDGSFKGKYEDANFAYGEDDYRIMTLISEFTGKFNNIKKIDDKTYSMELGAINYKHKKGKEWIENMTKYIATDAYGLQEGEKFTLYSPGKMLDGLDKEFLSWGYENYSKGKLLCWGLHNEKTGYGFFSENYIKASELNR